jgi:hypothetical protein
VAVIPVLVDGATMPDSADLPPSLRSLADRQAFPLAGVQLDQEVGALVGGIRNGQLAPLRLAEGSHFLDDRWDVRPIRRRRRNRAADINR